MSVVISVFDAWWRYAGMQVPHWQFPSPLHRKHVTKWTNAQLLPREWGTEHKIVLQGTKKKPESVAATKAFTAHVLLGSGMLAIAADWPRADGSPDNSKVVKLVVLMQQMHRHITADTIYPAVSTLIPLYPYMYVISCIRMYPSACMHMYLRVSAWFLV
jgi:hypothetical protein